MLPKAVAKGPLPGHEDLDMALAEASGSPTPERRPWRGARKLPAAWWGFLQHDGRPGVAVCVAGHGDPCGVMPSAVFMSSRRIIPGPAAPGLIPRLSNVEPMAPSTSSKRLPAGGWYYLTFASSP